MNLAYELAVTLVIVLANNRVSATDDLTVLRLLHDAYPEWTPRGIVDVGANVGQWTRLVQDLAFPGVPTFMIEASTAHEGALEEVKGKYDPGVVDYRIAVLTGADGETVEFYDNHRGRATGNSIFREQTQFFEGVKPEKRTTSKLDTVVGHMEHVDYIKVDVQGAELLVLSGGSDTLARASFVQLEISVVEYNKGGSCWHEVDEVLRRHGFTFYDSDDYQRDPGLFRTKGIGQFDALYVKPSSLFLPSWFAEKNIEFCGMGRGLGVGGVAQNQNQTTAVDDADKISDENEDCRGNSGFSIMVVLVAFVGGYAVCYMVERKRYQQKWGMFLGLVVFALFHTNSKIY